MSKTKNILIAISAIILFLCLCCILLIGAIFAKRIKNDTTQINRNNQIISKSQVNFPKFNKIDKLCDNLPIDKIDKIVKEDHLDTISKSSLSDVKSCEIEYSSKKSIIFEFDYNLSLEESKKSAKVLEYKTGKLENLKTDNLVEYFKNNPSKINQITFAIDDDYPSILSVRLSPQFRRSDLDTNDILTEIAKEVDKILN